MLIFTEVTFSIIYVFKLQLVMEKKSISEPFSQTETKLKLGNSLSLSADSPLQTIILISKMFKQFG